MRTHIAAACTLALTSLAHAQTPTPAAPIDAAGYLEAALDQIEKGSGVYSTDWTALRAKARKAIESSKAKTPADTYPAIRDALATLGDKHGLLVEPEAVKAFNPPRTSKATGLFVDPRHATVAWVVAGSPAAIAGIARGDRIVDVEGQSKWHDLPRREFDRLFRSGHRPDGSAAPLDLRVRTADAEPRAVQLSLANFDDFEAPIGRRLDGGIGYLELPGLRVGPKAASYDDAAHEWLDTFDDGTWRGCIVDLRRNTGGTLWPMLAAVGPLAGDGALGAFASSSGSADWSYDAERGLATSGSYELAKVETPHALHPDLPVAVLTGPLTTGAGEAIAVAFAGRAHTRRFGEGTRGLPTSNTQIPLADGALLVLTVTVHADRAGTRYETVIAPDEPAATDWTHFGAAEDPAVAAACRWLASAQAK